MVKSAMKCIKHRFSPFLEPYFQIILENYNNDPIPTFLYTVENAVTIFYNSPDHANWLR
jgi:hypothetical protein